MGRTTLTTAAAALRFAALVSAATCLVWILGSTGTGLLFDGPEQVRETAGSFDREAAAGFPRVAVEVDGKVFLGTAGGLNTSDGYSVPGAFAEYSLDFIASFYEPSGLQRLAYVGLQCLLSLGIAWLCWTLARLVLSAREGDPFTHTNVGRLRAIGWLVLVGSPAYVVGMWLVHRWLLATSELAGEASLWPLGWRDVPWGSIGVGLAVLVLAAVWQRGVAMRHDVEGLV